MAKYYYLTLITVCIVLTACQPIQATPEPVSAPDSSIIGGLQWLPSKGIDDDKSTPVGMPVLEPARFENGKITNVPQNFEFDRPMQQAPEPCPGTGWCMTSFHGTKVRVVKIKEENGHAIIDLYRDSHELTIGVDLDTIFVVHVMQHPDQGPYGSFWFAYWPRMGMFVTSANVGYPDNAPKIFWNNDGDTTFFTGYSAAYELPDGTKVTNNGSFYLDVRPYR